MEQFTVEEVVSLMQQPAEFLETLKNEDGEWKPKEELVKSLSDGYSSRLQKIVAEQKGRAVRERMGTAQKFIRENYGIESDGQIEDHLRKLVETYEGKGGKIIEKEVELTEESARKHPIFQKLLKSEVIQRASELEKERDEWKKKYERYTVEEETKKLDTAIYKHTNIVLSGIKAALDKDAAKRDEQVEVFVAALKSMYKFKLDEEGLPFPVNQNGDPLEDSKTFSRITFADLVKKRNIFGVHDFDPNKSSPGATSQPIAPHTNGQVIAPSDQQSLMAQLKALPGEANKPKREALMKAFKANQQAK